MSKSKKALLDHDMAEEHGKELSPFVLTLKHAVQLKTQSGGFYFAYRHNEQVWYDHVPVFAQAGGVRVKPERFLMPRMVRQRLTERNYSRWYFYDARYLYPLQTTKFKTLEELFWFVDDPDPSYTTSVICDPGAFNLRKKPLLGVRQSTVTWEDCTPPRLTNIQARSKSTHRELLLTA